MRLLAAAALIASLLPLGEARADPVSTVGAELDKLGAEAAKLASGVRASDAKPATREDTVARRIVAAQANFGAGNYDGAALVLYDIVEKHPRHPEYDTALYYLAESLFQKGERLVARGFFTRLASERGPKSKFYRQALERLIELTLLLDDKTGAKRWLAALDQVPAAEQKSSVPYIRGKYYYFSGDHDRAIKHFRAVAATSPYYFQARYFLGVARTAKKQLDAAAKTFAALLKRKARNDDQRRIQELCHLAIGRLHYEREQPSRAIDSYLNINRQSDLFAEALFEAAWVYVKNKDFEKALHALELLALSDPNSYRMPEVRILEANLRIRRAKKLEETGLGDPLEEYSKAGKLFEKTRGAFEEPHAALAKIVAGQKDPRMYLEQLTGRASSAFETQATMPEVAASWLRQEPAVERLIDVETDLGTIAGEIQQAELIVERLERALVSPIRVEIFPKLAARRNRGVEIFERVLALRGQLVKTAALRARPSATEKSELSRLTAARQRLERQVAARYGRGRETATKKAQVKSDERRVEITTRIEGLEAQLVALDKSLAAKDKVSRERRAEIKGEMKSLRVEIDEMRVELASLSNDGAGGGPVVTQETSLRKQLREALDVESRFLTDMARRSPEAAKAVAELRKANRIASTLERMFERIDGLVDQALAEVRRDLEAEKAKLAAYRQEFENFERESAALAAETLAPAVATVATKFYQILVRTDVGAVDVAWARQEEATGRHRKATLDQARELRTLDADFAELLREMREEQSASEEDQ